MSRPSRVVRPVLAGISSVALLATACGDDGETADDAPPTQSFDEWQAAAVAICEEYHPRLDAVEDGGLPIEPAAAAAFVDEYEPILVARRDAFAALDPPVRRAVEVRDLQAFLDEEVDALAETRRLGEAGDRAAYIGFLVDAPGIEDVEDLVLDLGLVACTDRDPADQDWADAVELPLIVVDFRPVDDASPTTDDDEPSGFGRVLSEEAACAGTLLVEGIDTDHTAQRSWGWEDTQTGETLDVELVAVGDPTVAALEWNAVSAPEFSTCGAALFGAVIADGIDLEAEGATIEIVGETMPVAGMPAVRHRVSGTISRPDASLDFEFVWIMVSQGRWQLSVTATQFGGSTSGIADELVPDLNHLLTTAPE